MSKKDYRCETCRCEAERLFQSYGRGGAWECAECGLDDAGASPAQLARVQRYITRRGQALKNFGRVVEEPAALAAAVAGRLLT